MKTLITQFRTFDQPSFNVPINEHQPWLRADDAIPGELPRRPTRAGGAGQRRWPGQRCSDHRGAITADSASRSNCALSLVSSAAKPRTLVEILEKTASHSPDRRRRLQPQAAPVTR